MQKILVLAALLLALPAAAAVPQLQAPAEVRALLSEFLDLDELPDVPAQTAFERRMQVEVASLGYQARIC